MSYQLKKWPRKRSSRSIAAKAASQRSITSRAPIQPKSRADTIDRRYSPILVGDVLWATTGFGVSWKLSGGSMLSAAVTNVSKKRQVRRATSRSAVASLPLTARLAAAPGGRLARQATRGETVHSASSGAATIQVRSPAAAIRSANAPPQAAPAASCNTSVRVSNR